MPIIPLPALALATLSLFVAIVPSLSAAPVPFVVAGKIADQQNLLEPDQVHLDGFLGQRISANEKNRLVIVDEDRLLVSYRNRPGIHRWDGEHVGKWLHAATLAWVNTGDPALRAKLDRVVRELLKCQDPNGYLGTYVPEERWTSWDVWSHKYNLIGLLTYYRYTGDTAALDASRRMGDLLDKMFGEKPGQLNIVESGAHAGMAASSVLQPMVWLYRLTGEPRYLEFCNMILRRWEGPGGPHLISDLSAGRGVHQTGNAKAYEMMSCFNGALELYRVTGEARILNSIRHAWEDIVTQRLYLTGTCSQHEFFHTANELPNAHQDIAETCVTVTWLQLNAQLLRLTGESRFADELERTGYNQLLGAQQPDGASWGYYVELEGNRKPFSADFSGHCCLSSGPRGIALLPMVAAATDKEGAIVNFYERGEAHYAVGDDRHLTLRTETDFPLGETIRLVVAELDRPGRFALKLRIPGWARDVQVTVAGTSSSASPRTYHAITRDWQVGDTIELRLPPRPRLIMGQHGNIGLGAVLYGPLVLAADDRVNAEMKIGTFQLFHQDIAELDFSVLSPDVSASLLSGTPVFQIKASTLPEEAKGPRTHDLPLRLVPYANAGYKAPYKIWMPTLMWRVPPESVYGPKVPPSEWPLTN